MSFYLVRLTLSYALWDYTVNIVVRTDNMANASDVARRKIASISHASIIRERIILLSSLYDNQGVLLSVETQSKELMS